MSSDAPHHTRPLSRHESGSNLLKAVKGELGVIDVDLHRILHELLADGAHVLAERSREHHHLLLVRRGLEDLLHVLAHVELLEHLVALVQDKVLQVLQGKLLGTDQSQNPVKQCGQADDTEVLIEKTIAGNQNEGKLKTNVSRNDKAVSKAVSSVKSTTKIRK